MQSLINQSVSILNQYLEEKNCEKIDREQIVAHALLSGLIHHWPSQSDQKLKTLLSETQEIKKIEYSRWITQRRIALAKLARLLDADDRKNF